MKTRKFLLSLFFNSGVFISLFAQTANDASQAQLMEEFKASTETWKSAYNSKDAKKLVPLYTEDAGYISSHVAGLELKGREKLINNFQKGMDMGGHIDSVEILSMNVSCDIATLLCKYQATNSGVTVVGRNLLVMKKINGIWYIAIHMTVV